MNNVLSCVVAAGLLFGAVPLVAQDTKNPNQQQGQHPENNPPPQNTAPNGSVAQPSTQSDQQSGDSGKSSKRKHKNDAHQAHGTPQPTPQS